MNALQRLVLLVAIACVSVLGTVNSFAGDPAKQDQYSDRNNVIPIIRLGDYYTKRLEFIRKRDPKGKFDHVYEKLNSDLIVSYSVDMPKLIMSFSTSGLKRLNMNRAQLRKLAQKNLLRKLGNLKTTNAKGVFFISANESFESSLMLVDSIWDKKRIPVKGDFVVFIPVRSVLLVTGSHDKKGIALARQIAGEVYQKFRRKITVQPFVRKNGKWVRFKQ